MKLLLIIISTISMISCSKNMPQALILLAHFDDESMMSRTLYKLKDTHELHFIYLTKGEGGTDLRDSSIKGESLSKLRIIENDIVMKLVNAKKRHILNFPDVPLRIPEKGYPNPLGRPTTDVDLFFKSKIWNLNKIVTEVQNIIDKEDLKPELVFTLSDDKGVIHAHHQSCEKVIQKLKFKKNLKTIYGITEDRYYSSKKLKRRKTLITKEYKNERTLDFVYRIHQAYQSQMLANFKKEDLKKSNESLYIIKETH